MELCPLMIELNNEGNCSSAKFPQGSATNLGFHLIPSQSPSPSQGFTADRNSNREVGGSVDSGRKILLHLVDGAVE